MSAAGIDPRLSGAQHYSMHAERPGMWHAAFVRSPHAHARVERVDAAALPAGCVALLPEDVADLRPYGCQARDQRVLADVARHVGDVVAAVAAPTRAAAVAAARAIEVAYTELPAVFDPVAAVAPGAPLLHPDTAESAGEAVSIGVRALPGTNVCHRFRIRSGDVAAGFAAADVVVQREFRTPSAAHAPMEPHAALAEWDGGRLTLTTGTQTPFNLRTDIAHAFGLPEDDVRVIAPPMGGSFGAKTFVRLEALVAALARKVGRPVKAVLDRTEEFVCLNRHPATMRVRIGARRDGTLVAKELDCWVDTGAYADCGPGVATKLGYAGVGPYRIPHVRVDALAVYTNLPPNGAYRGYGAMQSVWASERTMDALARELGMSPLELRRMNLLRDGDAFATGEVMHDVHFEECLQAAADAVGYEQDPDGAGLCVLLKGMQTPSRAAISVERTPVGYVVRSAACEMGQGIKAAIRLMAAEQLGCEPGQIELPDPDTDTSPYDTRTTSSRSTHMMGRALAAAGDRPARERRRARLRRGRQRGRPGPRHRPGRRVDPLAPGRRGGAPERRRGDRPRRGRARPRRRLRRPRGRPRGRRAAERGLDDHGPRHGAVRGDRLRGRAGREREPVRLQRARRRATCRRASRTSCSSARAPRPTGWARRCSRRCRPRSATRCTRSASTCTSCR